MRLEIRYLQPSAPYKPGDTARVSEDFAHMACLNGTAEPVGDWTPDVELARKGVPIDPPHEKLPQLRVKFCASFDIFNPGDVASFDYDVAHALACQGHARAVDFEADEAQAYSSRAPVLQQGKRVGQGRPPQAVSGDASPFRFHGLGDKMREAVKP